jgi:hypothetical protein
MTKSERFVAAATTYVNLNSGRGMTGGRDFPPFAKRKKEPAFKPGSVEGNHSSGTHVAVSL